MIFRRSSQRRRNHIDLTTLIAVLMLMVLSLGVVYSASSTYSADRWKDSEHLLGNHIGKVVLGFVAIFLAIQIDYTVYRRRTGLVLLGVVGLLLVTLALGGEVKGAARFLRFGGFGLQPSEVAKFALIFHLAALLERKLGENTLQDFKKGYVPVMSWLGLVAVLVLLQPAFSTGFMIITISLLMIYLAGVRMKHLALTVLPAVPVLAAYLVFAPYRRARLMDFFQQLFDGGTQGMHHQVLQGLIGFANGGILGLGPGLSRQKELYLPESYGDFAFAILGEEYGLIGTVFVMSLYLVLVLRGLKIARHAPDPFARNLAFGITLSFGVYALVNAAVTLALLPVTGLPLPFISYGGSSMLFSAFAVGVLLNISSQTNLNPRIGTAGTAEEQQPAPAVGRVY